MARYRAVLEYDGTAYAGFQRQTRRGGPAGRTPTIQETLEQALASLGQADARVLGAGRTDAGVHARGQVVAWDGQWRHGDVALQRALNARLPADIAVRALDEAPAGFHPRFDARSRTYEYTLYLAPVRPVIGRQYVWHERGRLDAEPIVAATRLLLGEHDFGAFGQPMRGETTVRMVLNAAWYVREPYWIFEIEANAFLYRMVRSLVGTLRAVGRGELGVHEFGAILAAAERRRAGPTAPAHGLCLTQVTY